MKVRPIDANKAKIAIKDICDEYCIACGKHYGGFAEKLATVIEKQPTLDYEPVVHAHWIQEGFDCKCSNCGSFNGAFGVKYCQDCGAKMDEEVK